MTKIEEIKKLREMLAAWAREVSKQIGTDGIHLFGSLVYQDGAQFVPGSDVDLAIVFPGDAKTAISRTTWLDKLGSLKLN